MIKVTKKMLMNGRKHLVTVPVKFVRELGWTKETLLQIEVVDNAVVIKIAEEVATEGEC